MLKRFCLLLNLGLLIIMLSGCTSIRTASLDSEFTLSVGQSARIASESLDIKFISVTADSRCPKDVQCVWAGQVSCAIEITKEGNKTSINLTDTAGSGKIEGYTFQNYKITFSVSPYPEANKTIAKEDYRLSLMLKKK
jgi:hypothetical protein